MTSKTEIGVLLLEQQAQSYGVKINAIKALCSQRPNQAEPSALAKALKLIRDIEDVAYGEF